jgi:hypothetical protein
LRNSKILGYILVVVNLASFVVFGLTAHTIIGVLSSSSPMGSESPVIIDASTKLARVSFEMQPKNSGFLEAEVTLGVRIVTSETSLEPGEETSFKLAPGESRKVTLTLTVPEEKLRLYSEGKGSLELATGVKTLYNLARMDYKVRLVGGESK